MALPLYYNWRSLFVRKLITTLTFVVVAVVVFVLAVLLSFAAGINASLAASGSNRNILVLKPGATAESTSIIMPEEVGRLYQTPGMARDEEDQPLLSQELCVQTSIPRRSQGGALANAAVRGVDDVAFLVHEDVRMIEGRRPNPGAMEAIVGHAALKRYADLDIGRRIPLGRLTNREFEIVGIFQAGGGSLESELWAPRTLLTDAYQRPLISSVAIKLTDADLIQAAMDYVNGPTVKLLAKRETDYYQDLSARSRDIVMLTCALIGIMGIGAVFAVANTMYAAVDGRRREIAMLRTLGFRRRAVLVSFVMESLLICVSACLFGITASMFLHGTSQDYLSDTTWTVLAYELRMTPTIFLTALIVAGLVGLAGALAPALRASRMPIIDALRKS